MTDAELEALLALPITPVGWQRRRNHDLPSDPPGVIHQWKQCAHHESPVHFDKDPTFEYRPIYGPEAMSALAEARAEVGRLRGGLSDLIDHVEAINSEWDASALHDARAALEGRQP